MIVLLIPRLFFANVLISIGIWYFMTRLSHNELKIKV